METKPIYAAFDDNKLIFKGDLSEIILKIKSKIGKADHTSILIFNELTGKTLDFNFHGTVGDVQKRLDVYVADDTQKHNSGPGRPKLGVTCREISLLPQHWEWLATQSGGASGTLRKLVDEAQRKNSRTISSKQAQERTYRFMSVIAGDAEGYEEALRALYKKDEAKFLTQIEAWPRDVKSFAMELSKSVFKD